MSLNEIVTVRPEVLRKEGLEGVIDIENRNDPKNKSIESRPEDFFNITYPTSDIQQAIEHLNHRFNSNEKSAGLFLLEGFKGSGKSHLELLIFNLLKFPEIGEKWLSKHKLKFDIPRDTIILIRKFTDFPLDSIWTLVFSELGEKSLADNSVPDLNQFRKALGDRKLVLILDELEMGIKSIANENLRAKNLSFLQMLSEESLRTDKASVTIFASIYDSGIEPGSTLKRVSPVDIKFNNSEDRLKIILHRLFLDYETTSIDKVEEVIASFKNGWMRQDIKADEKYLDKMKRTFPFSPDLMDMVLLNVQASGGFQGTRGALGLLANVIRNNYKSANIITSSSLDITDKAISNRLSDLDSSHKILSCAQNDFDDLQSHTFIKEIIGTVVISTLAPSGHIKGISENDLAREVLKPGDDINDFHSTLRALLKFGTYFQEQEGNYFFDITEKPNSKVEYRSLRIDPNKAREYAMKILRDAVFKDSRAIIFKDMNQVRVELNSADKNSLRFIISPKRLNPEERQQLYNGAENRNQIVLLEPRDEKFNALDNSDIMKWAQRAIAAEELEDSSSDSRKTQYEKIKNQDRGYIRDAFKNAGFVYLWFQYESGKIVSELESLGNSLTRDDVIKFLREEIHPQLSFEEHLLSGKDRILNNTVKDIESDYKKTLGFPVQTHSSTFLGAIKNLCSAKKIGLRHEKDSACGRLPVLTENEIYDSIITEPFEDSKVSDSFFEGKKNVKIQEETDTYSDESDEAFFNAMSDHTIESLQTHNVSSIGALRQEVASRLIDYDEPVIKSIQFNIFIEESNAELNSYSSVIRGTLSGTAYLSQDLIIRKQGDFSKAQVEQMIEMLPVFNNAKYKVELKVKLKDKVTANE